MRQTIDKIIGSVLAFLMGLMLVSVLWQVFTRYALQSPSTFTDELARFLLIWIGVFGAAYVSGKKMHLAIDLLPTKLEGRSRQILLMVIDLLIIVFALTAFVIGGGQLVYITYILGQTSAALQIPMTYVYSILPVSGLLIIYYKSADIMNMNFTPEPGQPSPSKENL